MEENKPITDVTVTQQNPVDAEGRNRPVLIQKLVIRPLHRKEQDIASMLAAIRQAEATIPRRTELYMLYEDFLSTDGHLRAVCDKYLMGVTGKEWQYLEADGSENEAMKQWIDSPDFEMTIREIANSELWGYTMLEFDFYGDGTFGVFLIPRRHMRPHLGVVAKEQTGNSGINVREGVYADTILEVGDERNLGLLMVAAQYVIFKRGSLSDWAQFAEVFGQPLVDAVWDGFDENQRQLLLEAIDNMGSGGKIVRPAGTQLQLQNGGANNPTGELYRGIIDVCNAEISKTVLGQTETTESSDTSGYAQASVHAGTEDDINTRLCRFVKRILNRRVMNILIANKAVKPGGSFSIKGEGEEKMTRQQALDMEVKLKNDVGLPIDDDYFYEKYKIEKPADYEAQKAKIEAQKAAGQVPGGFGLALRSELLKMRDEGFFDEPRA